MGNRVLVTRNKLDLLADSISAKSGESLPLTIGEMKIAVDGIVLNSYTIGDGNLDVDENDYLYFDDDGTGIVPTGTITITANGTYNVTQYASAEVNISGSTVQTQTKTATPTESQQTISPDSGYLLSSVTVNAISSTYVGTGIDQNDSDDLTVSGATVTAPAGYYAESVSKSVASGTAGTPSATKGTVSNHQVSITPSVTNTTGYITGGTKNGTAVTVTAAELASGNKAITSNGTDIDVVGYSTVSVAVPADEPNLQAKTGIAPTTSSQTITADSGYDGLSSVQINAMPSGTASTPATTITANPSISINSSGLITATTSASQSVTPTVSAGYVSSGTAGTVTVSGSKTQQLTTQAAKTVTPTESEQTAVAANVYTTGIVKVGAISSTYVGSGIDQLFIEDVYQEDEYVIIPPGYYDEKIEFQTSFGTEGRPVATKGEVSNNSVTITPSVENSRGYIQGGTLTGTQVTVSASELVSGTLSITSSGTKDVTNYASASVAAGTVTAPSSISGTAATISTGTNTLTLTKIVSVTPSVSTAGYISSGTAGNSSVSLTASVTTQAATTYNTSTTDQTIASGTYLTGTQTIKGVTVSGLDASKILSGTTVMVGDANDADRIASVSGSVTFSTIRTGTSAPSSSLGENGDIYIQS